MLSKAQTEALLAAGTVRYKTLFTLDCALNRMMVPARALTLQLSESQKRLLLCLTHGIGRKEDIAGVVWDDAGRCDRDRSYYHLVFSLRARFKQYGLPDGLIVTAYKTGIRLDEPLLREWLYPVRPPGADGAASGIARSLKLWKFIARCAGRQKD